MQPRAHCKKRSEKKTKKTLISTKPMRRRGLPFPPFFISYRYNMLVTPLRDLTLISKKTIPLTSPELYIPSLF